MLHSSLTQPDEFCEKPLLPWSVLGAATYCFGDTCSLISNVELLDERTRMRHSTPLAAEGWLSLKSVNGLQRPTRRARRAFYHTAKFVFKEAVAVTRRFHFSEKCVSAHYSFRFRTLFLAPFFCGVTGVKDGVGDVSL